MASEKELLDAIRTSGGRVTAQRRVICEYLADTHTHPTPAQVFDAISQDNPDISLATVYNTLNMLQELGAIVGINFGSGHTHFETNTEPHINLVCLRCHSITDLPIDQAMDLESEAWREGGFEPVAYKMDVFGFCEECREAKRLEIQDELARKARSGNGKPRHTSTLTSGGKESVS